ncbi:MAG: DUF4381 domain-containing protein [Verrucomicrobiae bacterium]|nr:DUF4381 domain-containing protein [Verrucomicrobiae bacterium]
MNLRSATAAGRYLASMVAVRLGMPALWGATNSGSEDELLELMPPYQEMLPTWWELHGTWVVLGVAVMLAVVALLVWLWHRPKPVPPVPPEVLAREELEQLRQQPETGDVLSQVSRCVRRYVTAAFALPAEEFTTAEFCQVVGNHESIGSALASKLGDFLRRCDNLKFAPLESPTAVGAATQALELVRLGEVRRTELRQAARASKVQLALSR